MQTLTQADLLALWETGRSLHPLDQGVLAAQAALPEEKESIADWPMGRRNRVLAEWRWRTFGRALRGSAACRVCGEKLEFELDGRGMVDGAASASGGSVEVGGRRLRLPTSRDLATLVQESDEAAAVQRLLRQLSDDSERLWSKQEIATAEAALAAADPMAEIRLSFECPSCAASFEESLDLPTFVWAELEALARRLLSDVHRLASAYGWSEREILGLSAARREFYLERVRA
jgi:hypothetical protein